MTAAASGEVLSGYCFINEHFRCNHTFHNPHPVECECSCHLRKEDPPGSDLCERCHLEPQEIWTVDTSPPSHVCYNCVDTLYAFHSSYADTYRWSQRMLRSFRKD